MAKPLADFIRTNIESISSEWEKFAATLLPGQDFSVSVLRNGIIDILHEIADDMDCFQSAEDQQGKSEGEKRCNPEEDNAAETHAVARIRMGLSSRQLISEFRALRATVLRLWHKSNPDLKEQDIYDITRFNEAMDQALTEAAVRYSEKTDKARELFLGILGHDLRNPLAAITGLAHMQMGAKDLNRNTEICGHIVASAERMAHMITDLIELTRVQLGPGISINPSHIDMKEICSHVIEEMKAIYPDRTFQLNTDDELLGEWDKPRMSQVLSNLIGNAVQHGDPDSAITVTARKNEAGIEFIVHNKGGVINPEMKNKLFDMFIQGKAGRIIDTKPSTSLGLGLYIAKEIITAHNGTIEVTSSKEEGTNFIAFIPNNSMN